MARYYSGDIEGWFASDQSSYAKVEAPYTSDADEPLGALITGRSTDEIGDLFMSETTNKGYDQGIYDIEIFRRTVEDIWMACKSILARDNTLPALFVLLSEEYELIRVYKFEALPDTAEDRTALWIRLIRKERASACILVSEAWCGEEDPCTGERPSALMLFGFSPDSLSFKKLRFDYDTDGSVIFGVEEDMPEPQRWKGPIMEIISALR